VQRILDFATDLQGDEACGCRPLNGALRAARRHGLAPRLLDLRNSADTAGGDRQRVVGYAAIAFEAAPGAPAARETDDEVEADPTLGPSLLATARAEIADALGLSAAVAPDHPRLHRPGASFVTLHDARGDLRGCVGQLQARHPLGKDVRNNALAAAFGDRRFPSLTRAEWTGLQVEVSVLGPLQPLPSSASFDEAAVQLQPGIDGVLLAALGRQGTFLPQVWAQLPDRHDFLAALLRKAGLPSNYWHADVQLWRYRVTAFEEPRDARTH
jgi:MEMO1 family protein